jgi:23S rRNA (cytosine1962-C5)-methyltransferase
MSAPTWPRKKEGLKERTGVIHGETPTDPVVIEENGGVKILVDIRNGHKTGFYLDQRDNRLAAAKYTEGKRVLNCFCYTGGFGVYALQGGAKEVVNVDLSQNALDIARQNAELNGLDTSNTQFVRHDVFKLLREYREKGRSSMSSCWTHPSLPRARPSCWAPAAATRTSTCWRSNCWRRVACS